MRKRVCLSLAVLVCWVSLLPAQFVHYFPSKQSYAGRFDLKDIIQSYREKEPEILGRYLKDWSVSVIDRMPNVFIAEAATGAPSSYVEIGFESLHNGAGMVTFISHDRKSHQVTGEVMMLFEESDSMFFYPPTLAMQRNVYYVKVLQGAIASYLLEQPSASTPKTSGNGGDSVTSP